MKIPKLSDARNPFEAFNVLPTQTPETPALETSEKIQENFLKYVREENFSQALQLARQVPITSKILLVAYCPKTPQSLRNSLTLRVKSELTEKAVWHAALIQACGNSEADLVKEMLSDYTLGPKYELIKEKDDQDDQEHTLLHIAASNGHSGTCTALLALLSKEEQKTMLNEKDVEGDTPLHIAASNGHSSTCTTLLALLSKEEQKTMLNKKNEAGSTPLHSATLSGNGSTCTALLAPFTKEEQKSMLNEEDADGDTPLHSAAFYGNSSACTTLLALLSSEEQKSMFKKKNLNTNTPLHMAASEGYSSTCATLLALLTPEEQKSMLNEKNADGNTPLHSAALNGHSSTCTALLALLSKEEQKTMLNEKDVEGDTPLHIAASNGHSSTCTTLLALLSKEEQKTMLNKKNEAGSTPLYSATLSRNGSTCTALLAPFTKEEQKTMLNEEDADGDTPLHSAAFYGNSSACTTLLALLSSEEQKSMFKKKNLNTNTPLHMAASEGYSSTCATLLALLTPEEQKSMLNEKNADGNTPLQSAALNGHSSTCTTLLAPFSLEEQQQLIRNDIILQIFSFENYVKTCKQPFLSSIVYHDNYATLLDILNTFPEKVCKEHPHYNPLKIAFIFRSSVLAGSIQLYLNPEQFWAYLHDLIEENPKLAPYIADIFFSIDRTHLQMGNAKKKTEPLNLVDSDFIKYPHAKDSQEVTTLVKHVVQSVPHLPREFDTLEKQREHLYPMLKQFATYLSLFDTINWTKPSEKGYIALDGLTIEPPMGESHAPAKDVLIPHLKKWLVILLYNVFFKHPFVGTPTAGTPYLKDFYEEIEHELCHLLKNFIAVDHEDSVAMKKRNRSLIVLAEAGAHCGGRYATNVDEEYRTHCLKQASTFENSVYNDLCTTRKNLLDAMNSGGGVHNEHKLLYFLGPVLGITHSPFQDPTLGLDKYPRAQIAQEKKNHLDKFLSQYTPSIVLQNTSMMLTYQKMKDAFVDWASNPEKKLFPAPPWAEDLQGQVQSLENHVVVSFYTEPSEKGVKTKRELQELLKENEDKGVYKRPKETGMQAVLSAIRAHISQQWIEKIEGDKVVVQPYAQLRALHELKVIRLL